jgi:tetratricopeptide (TPR) repeat protein
MADKNRLAAARAAAEARDYAQTERLARELIDEDPKDLVALDLLGYALYFLGKIDESEQVCRRTLELSANRPYAHKGLGLCLAKKGRIDEATRSLERAIELKPEWFDPYWDLSVSLVDAKRYTEAIEVARRGRAALPDRAKDWDRMEKHARATGARAR